MFESEKGRVSGVSKIFYSSVFHTCNLTYLSVSLIVILTLLGGVLHEFRELVIFLKIEGHEKRVSKIFYSSFFRNSIIVMILCFEGSCVFSEVEK